MVSVRYCRDIYRATMTWLQSFGDFRSTEEATKMIKARCNGKPDGSG
jgi:hypothetical protein